MNCPTCGIHLHRTLETRRRASGAVVRRYECFGAPGTALHRWTTIDLGDGEFLDRRTKRRSPRERRHEEA